MLLSITTFGQFELKYSEDTVRYERSVHIFPPMTVTVKGGVERVHEVIDSIHQYRKQYMDSLERDRLYNAFTLYRVLKKGHIVSEFDVTDEFIKENGIVLNDSAAMFIGLGDKILDTLIRLRLSKGFDSLVGDYGNHEFHEDIKYMIVKDINKPVMFIERHGCCFNDYTSEIVEMILSVRYYRKVIFSNNIRNINVTVIKTNKFESFIYLKISTKNSDEIEKIKIY